MRAAGQGRYWRALALVALDALTGLLGQRPNPVAAEQSSDDGAPGKEKGPAAGESPRVRAQERALRLAEALHDEDALLELYDERSRRSDASRSTLEALVAAAEGRGVPERAVAVLERRVRDGKDPATSAELLASLLTREHRSRDAAVVWGKLAALRGTAGLSSNEALTYARMLSQIGDTEKAWRVLASLPPDKMSRAHWAARAFVAWQLNLADDAERSYTEAWKLGENTPEARQRLGILGRVRGDVSSFVRLVKIWYLESRDPDALLDAAGAELDVADWDGLGDTLALAGREDPGRLAAIPAYWTLRASWAGHIGDKAAAWEAWDHAFALTRQSSVAAEYLRSALARDRRADLERTVSRVIAAAQATAAEVREPLALALIGLGRGHEALRLRSRDRVDRASDAALWDPDGMALLAIGQNEAALRLRRRAYRNLLAQHHRVALETAEGRQRFMEIAETLEAVRGAETRARWMRDVLTRLPSSVPPAARAYLHANLRDSENRSDAARALWIQASADEAVQGEARRHLLQLALDSDDRLFLRTALQQRQGQSDSALIDAALRVGDAGAARDLLRGMQGNTEAGSRGDQERALRLLLEQHEARVTGGGTYERIGALSAVGPSLGASFPWRAWRVGLEASAGQIFFDGDPGGSSPAGREGEALLAFRHTGDGAATVSELAGGFGYHSAGSLPRLRAIHETWARSWCFLSFRGALFEKIDDAPLLRALGTGSSGTAAVRLAAGSFYGSLVVRGREDRSRQLVRLGTEVSEDVEVGVRIGRHLPDVEVGVRAHAQQRDNATELPAGLAMLWPQSSSRAADQLPPTYSSMTLVARVARGGVGDHLAPSAVTGPHYECGLEIGVRLPVLAPASGGRCAIGVRVGSKGTLQVAGVYGWGLAALARGSSARITLGYDQRF